MKQRRKNSMAVYNLQALADKTKYLMSTQNMTAQEAEAQVFKEAGITDMNQDAYAEYQRLLTEGTTNSEYARNDRDRILDRRATTEFRRYEEPTAQEPPQEPTV
jgi:hypothetical protein